MRGTKVRKTMVVHADPAAQPAIRVMALTQPRQRPRAPDPFARRKQPQRNQQTRSDRRLACRMLARPDRLLKLLQIKRLNVSPDDPRRMVWPDQSVEID